MMMRAENFFILRRKPVEVRAVALEKSFIGVSHTLIKKCVLTNQTPCLTGLVPVDLA